MSYDDYSKATSEIIVEEIPQLYFKFYFNSKKKKSKIPVVKHTDEPKNKKQKIILSFQDDDEDEDEITIKPMKDPTVDTHFLPDKYNIIN